MDLSEAASDLNCKESEVRMYHVFATLEKFGVYAEFVGDPLAVQKCRILVHWRRGTSGEADKRLIRPCDAGWSDWVALLDQAKPCKRTSAFRLADGRQPSYIEDWLCRD